MKQISTIEGAVVAVVEWQSRSAFNYAFYDPITGEVWARRVLVDTPHSVWKYSCRPKRSMDITIPIEWLEDRVPAGLLAAILMGDGSQH